MDEDLQFHQVDETLNFRFLDGDQRRPARITAEALCDKFGAVFDPIYLIRAYRENAAAIDAKALEHYRRNPEREVLLMNHDF